jgi:hypothetical protein
MGSMNVSLLLDGAIVVQSAGAHERFGRIHILGRLAFGKQPPNFLLREIDRSPSISK